MLKEKLYLSSKDNQNFERKAVTVLLRSNLTSPYPDKIYASTWIPQNDIMGHPNLKAFVSHCGKNGQYEALYHAVPVVAVPIFGDQPYNAERMRVKGFAEVLDLRTSTVEEMVMTIMQVCFGRREGKGICVWRGGRDGGARWE